MRQVNASEGCALSDSGMEWKAGAPAHTTIEDHSQARAWDELRKEHLANKGLADWARQVLLH
jgi:hypothetical protein